MGKHEEGYNSSSFWQLIIAIPGSIIGFTLLIALLAHFLSGSTPAVDAPAAQVAAAPAAASAEAPAASAPAAEAAAPANENIAPEAAVEVAAAPGSQPEKSGEEVVKAVCSMCHSAGLMNAPKIGDAGQWEPRIAKGYDTLVDHAKNGFNAMPARGGNPDLTDNEVAAAVKHMANASGASF